MREGNAERGLTARFLWRAFGAQIVLALAWNSVTAALEEWRLRSQGPRRTLLGVGLLKARVAEGMIWFSVGWLGAADHGMDERQVALVAGGIAAAAAKFEVMAHLVRGAASTGSEDCCGVSAGRALALTLMVLAQVAYAALAAVTGARQAAQR